MEPVRRSLARFTDDILTEIEAYADRLDGIVVEALSETATGEPRVVSIALTLRLSSTVEREFDLELAD